MRTIFNCTKTKKRRKRRGPQALKRWKDAYEAFFPGESDRANAIFVEVDIDHRELWIRGVSPEPFGLRATMLEQDAGRDWRAVFG